MVVVRAKKKWEREEKRNMPTKIKNINKVTKQNFGKSIRK